MRGASSDSSIGGVRQLTAVMWRRYSGRLGCYVILLSWISALTEWQHVFSSMFVCSRRHQATAASLFTNVVAAESYKRFTLHLWAIGVGWTLNQWSPTFLSPWTSERLTFLLRTRAGGYLDCLCCEDIIKSESTFSSDAKLYLWDVCCSLILSSLWVKCSSDRDVAKRIWSFFKIKDCSASDNEYNGNNKLFLGRPCALTQPEGWGPLLCITDATILITL